MTFPVHAAPIAATAQRFAPIDFVSGSSECSDRQIYGTRIARTDVHFDQPMDLVAAKPLQRTIVSAQQYLPKPQRTPDIIGSGWLGQALRGFRCWVEASGQTVCFDDGAGFWVSADGSCVEAFALPADAALREELLLGPALLLALAQRGVFGLHASAILGNAGAVLLLGPSGSGKSTLARHALGEGGLRLADDVAPVWLAANGPRLLPRFPQLKLSPALCVDDLELPVAAMIWVEIGEGALAMTQLGQTEVSRCLLRDSVAARLFTPALLARHLDTCAALAMSIPGWRVLVPRAAPEQRAGVIHSAYQLLRVHGLP